MAKKNITVNIDCDDFCPYDTEEIFSTVQEMISIFNQKDPHKVYEALDNDHGFIVGNAYDETEFFFEEDKIKKDDLEQANRTLFLLKAKNLLLYLNHCLKWVINFAFPNGWENTKSDYDFLVKERRYIINMFYRIDPQGYDLFLIVEPETKMFNLWNPLDGVQLPKHEF